MKSVSDCVIAIDSEDRIKFMNSAAEKLTSCSKESSMGKDFYEIFNFPVLKIDATQETNLDDIVDGEVFINSKTNVKTMIEGKIIPIDNKNGIGKSKIIIFHNKNP